MAKLRVFISWSGERSKQVAVALRESLPLVLHYVDPWMSETDIEAGERWAQSVGKELAGSNFGVVCVTQENMTSPWLLFEAGALAKSFESGKVIPLLLDLELSDISGPLVQFQAKKLTRAGVSEVINSLQGSAVDEAIHDDRARHLFDLVWPDLENKLEGISKEAPAERHRRPQHEVLEELVSGVRSLDTRINEWSEMTAHITPRGRSRMHPMMLLEPLEVLSEGPGDPTAILILASIFRDDAPWLYELGVDAYHALRSRRSNAEDSVRRFSRAVDLLTHGPFMEEFGLDPRALSIVRHELPHVLERYARPKAVPPG